MKRHRGIRLVSSVLGVLLGGAVVVGTAAPASAENDGWCTDREFCLWEHWYLGGGMRDYYYPDYAFTDDTFWYHFDGANFPSPSNAIVNDRGSSAVNVDTRCKAVLHEHVNYGGYALVFPYRTDDDGVTVNDLGAYDMNDRASSLSWMDCY